MAKEIDKMYRAREILNQIIQGINPIDGTEINQDNFINNQRIIRCFSYIVSVLTKNIEYEKYGHNTKKTEFYITQDEIEKVELPVGKMGVNDFAKCINAVIDVTTRKRLTGTSLNKQLKKMGILSEETYDEGKHRTVINSESHKYGVESEKKDYNGREYEKVLFNDQGKKFLLDNLIGIMNYDDNSSEN